MTAPAFDQDTFRGRDDDVGLNVNTWNGGGGLGGDWTQETDVNFRVRFLIQETGGGSKANKLFTLHYNHEGAGYTAMTATSPIQPAATTQYAQADTTTQLIGVGTYISGESLGGVDDNLDSGNMDAVANEEFEIEWCLTIDSAQVADTDTILLRVYEADDTVLGSYTDTPTITVNEPLADPNVSESDGVTVGDSATLGPVTPTEISETDAVTIGDTATVEVVTGAAGDSIPYLTKLRKTRQQHMIVR